VIVRPYNVYGPRQRLDDAYRNVVGIFINKVMKGEAPIIYGDGEQTRAFSYIKDIIPTIVKCGFEAVSGETFNVGATQNHSINKLATYICHEFGITPNPVYVPDRPVEVKHAYCTSEKARRLLGHEDTTLLLDGVRETVAWAKEKGPQEFKYTDLEIVTNKTPSTWMNKTI